MGNSEIAKLWHRMFLKTHTAVVLEVKKDFFPSVTPSAKVMFDLPQNCLGDGQPG